MLIKKIARSITTSLIILLMLVPIALAGQDSDWLERGNQSFKRGDYQFALIEYRKGLVQADERFAEACYNIGVCYYWLGRKEDAAKWFRGAIKTRAGRYPNACFALGAVLEEQGRLKEAKEAFRQAAIASKGQHAHALFMLGLIEYREGDYESAIENYRKAIARPEGQLPAFHNNLGVALGMLGLLDAAEREFYIALRLSNGEFADARFNIELCRSLAAKKVPAMIAGLRTSAGDRPSISR